MGGGARPGWAAASVAEVTAWIEAVREIAADQSKAADLEARIEKMRTDARLFGAAAGGLISRTAPELAGGEPGDAVMRVHGNLVAAKEDRKLLNDQRRRKTDLERKLAEARTEM